MFARKNSLWLLVVVLTVSGCGLGDYEKRMTVAQERASYLSQENLVLGPAITFKARKPKPGAQPIKKTGDKKKKKKSDDESNMPNLFLRLPLGLLTEGKEVAPDAVLFKFDSVDTLNKLNIRAKPTNLSGFEVAYVGEGANGKRFEDEVERELKALPEVQATGFDSKGDQPPIRRFLGPTLVYRKMVVRVPDATMLYTLYLNRGAYGREVAIVLGQKANADESEMNRREETLKFCLGTLATGSDIAAARQDYHPPPKAE